jgi:hypothetical protein
MRVPAKYYMPYLEPERAAATPWARATPSELVFPAGGGEMGYHCCAEKNFVYLQENGTVLSRNKFDMCKSSGGADPSSCACGAGKLRLV